MRWVPVDRSDPLLDAELTRTTRLALELYRLSPGSAVHRGPVLRSIRSSLAAVFPEPVVDSLLFNGFAFSEDSETNPEIGFDAKMETLAATLAASEAGSLTAAQEDTLQEVVTRYLALLASSLEARYSLQQESERRIQEAKERFKAESWNAAIVHLALGTTWRSEDSSWERFVNEMVSAFAGGALPVTRHGQVTAHGQFEKHYRDASETDWSYFAGLRFLAGKNDFHWSMEGSYRRTRFRAVAGDETEPPRESAVVNAYGVTTGVEIKIAEGVWLELAIGGEFPEGDAFKSDFISLGSLKYAVAKESRYRKLRGG